MELKNIDLLSLQPRFLQKDPVTIALCKAFQPVFEMLGEEIKGILLYTNIDNLPGPVLDELAWGMNVTWYNTRDTLAARRETVKRALSVFARMGTAGAVRDAVAAGFGDAIVEEWWEYGGEPGYFRITIRDSSVTAGRKVDFLRVINAVKNITSWLDQIIVITEMDPASVYITPVLHESYNVTALPDLEPEFSGPALSVAAVLPGSIVTTRLPWIEEEIT